MIWGKAAASNVAGGYSSTPGGFRTLPTSEPHHRLIAGLTIIPFSWGSPGVGLAPAALPSPLHLFELQALGSTRHLPNERSQSEAQQSVPTAFQLILMCVDVREPLSFSTKLWLVPLVLQESKLDATGSVCLWYLTIPKWIMWGPGGFHSLSVNVASPPQRRTGFWKTGLWRCRPRLTFFSSPQDTST